VLSSALTTIAEEMGSLLVRSAYSSNIKERRDCSTALFDAGGRMVAQAEHIPVHLGAMPEAVAAVMAREPGPDDVFAVNDPYSGGTHLPDVTLVSPLTVHGETMGWAVNRAHHSDVGGMRPGSMPSDSREIWQEGLVIPPVRLVAEALELEYPMRVERYELEYGSGGAGRHRGGDGVVRAVRVLEPASLSLLTDQRRHAPAGARGGGPGRPGRNLLDGEELPPKASRELDEGSVVTVVTPGGGGTGQAGPGKDAAGGGRRS
jgi:N-methylhydantoinase B/oxoprolinase/acetone carboxylase alpha subunit